MRRTAFVLLIILSFTIAQAQDSYESPLRELLARVPDTANNRTQVVFGDRAAIAAAYPPARIPVDFAEFTLASENNDGADDDLASALLWSRIYLRTASSTLGQYIGVGGEIPDILGFDYFDVHQELSYGMPPEQTLHLSGNFDDETVRAALTAQGYAQVESSADELWCPEAACDMGTMMDMNRRNQANLFGGDLGRRFPLLMTETSILGSPSEAIVMEHVAVATGDQPSLADAPDFAAAIEALTRDGVLMQAMFFAPSALPPASSADGGLPAYTLLAFGDVATNEAQGARLVLIYTDEAIAARVAEGLPTRMEATPSLITNASWGELVKARRITSVSGEVVMTDVGLPAVVLTLEGARGTAEEILDASISDQNAVDFALPGHIFQLLASGVYRQDLTWLAIGGS